MKMRNASGTRATPAERRKQPEKEDEESAEKAKEPRTGPECHPPMGRHTHSVARHCVCEGTRVADAEVGKQARSFGALVPEHEAQRRAPFGGMWAIRTRPSIAK